MVWREGDGAGTGEDRRSRGGGGDEGAVRSEVSVALMGGEVISVASCSTGAVSDTDKFSVARS